MERSAFVRGFIPGVLIGLFSSVLLFNTLWREPNLKAQRQFSVWLTNSKLSIGSSLLQSQLSANSAMQPPGVASRHTATGRRENARANTEDHMQECDTTFSLQSQPVNKTSYLLVVLIYSTPQAANLRKTIRASWLSNHRSQQRYLARFVIGTKNLESNELTCENKEYGDLILLPDVTDSLKVQDWSSSLKLLKSFKWTMDNVRFSYILKCTDSTFAVIDTIIKELEIREQRNETGDFLWGFFAGGVQAEKEDRLSERYWFLCSHYLPFPQGGGYVISQSLVKLLLSLEKDLQHYTHDDIALGVWISPFSGIAKLHDVRFNSGYYSRGCNNVYVVTHKETESSMAQKYATMIQTGNICKQEFASRLSYVYNWTAPANRCCVRTPGIP